MNFKCAALWAAALLWTGGCSLPVSPPDDWPPEADTQAPVRPLDAAVTVSVTVDCNFRPAVRVDWLPVPDRDVALYRVLRTIEGTDNEVRYYGYGNADRLLDTGIEFPADQGAYIRYRYAIEAIDSSGNVGPASDSHDVALAVPPVLTQPLGTITSPRPQFSWESRYDDGKDYEMLLISAVGDTLISTRPGLVYEKKVSYGFDELARISAVPAPDRLELGAYRWLVRMILVDDAGHPAGRTGLATGAFNLQ